MDNSGGLGLSTISRTARKKRSNLKRRPESESPQEYHDDSVSLSSAPSDRTRGAPVEDNTKDLSSYQYNSRPSYANLANAEVVSRSGDEDGEVNESVRPNEATGELEDVGCHPGQPGSAYDGVGNQIKFKKVKLKIGGRTIYASSTLYGSFVSGASNLKSSHSEGKKVDFCGVPWKDVSKIGFSFVKMDFFGLDMTGESVEQGSKLQRSCKRKSIAKKYVSDELYNDKDDDEILYLKKLKSSKISAYTYTDYEDKTIGKHIKGQNNSSNLHKESMNSLLPRSYDEPDYMEEMESVVGSKTKLNNRNRRQELEVSKCSNMENSITMRRRAIQTSRDVSPGLGAGLTHFPTMLPSVTSRKQKEQLSEVEQQMKRAEAAKRRRMKNEKAARESEAEAIRKILGQDSSRKKREEKIKKQQQNRSQEKTSNSATVASNVIRWVMGPSGTVVTFPDKIGLPSIFEPKPSSYPPPREKCAAEIQSRISLFAVFYVTRQYTRRDDLSSAC